MKITWPRAVGEDSPEPATLVLRVEGPAALEIQHLSAVILERVNRFFGWQAIGRIALRQAPAAPPRAACPARRRSTPKSPPGSPTACRSKTRTCARRSAGWARPSSESEPQLCLGRAARHCHNYRIQLAKAGWNHDFKPTEFQLHITRREFCQSTAAVALATAMLGTSTLPPFPGQALAEDYPAADLMKPDAMPDLFLGDAKAPVTIVEYASMTCPHCAHFQETTFPELKKRYIDTGKVRYVLRDFPLDNLAGAVFVLARCAAKDDPAKYFSMVDTLFREQRTWAVEKPMPAADGDRQAGRFHRRELQRLPDESEGLDAMESVRQRAIKQFKVKSTPTFFINGTRVAGRRLDRGICQGDRPLSQGRIRVFRPGPAPRQRRSRAPPARKVWKTTLLCRWPVAPASAAIHSPANAAQDYRVSGLSPGRDYDSAKNVEARTMKLTRLRLLGFKSFVEPTDFLIEPGLTGVVGPNGCGKSNLVEALRWVMGESSYKSMRASSMDEVIFSGTNNRPARNNAEVGISIDNADALGAVGVQRFRLHRHRAPHRARSGLHLPHQRPRGARPRRADPVRRRLHRRALAGAGASGPHRRNHPGQARAAPPRAGRSRRRRRPACAPARGGTAAEGRGNQSAADRGRDRPARRPDRRPQEAGAPGDPLSHRLRAGAQVGGDALPSALDRRDRRGDGSRARQGYLRARGGDPRRRGSGSLQAPGARRRGAARIARGRGARRRGPAPPECRARRTSTARKPRAKDRIAELDLRLVQFAADGEREKKLAADAEAALARLAAEEDGIRKEAARKRRPPQRRRRQSGAGRRRAQRRREDFLRSHHRARRSHRPAPSARNRRARARRAHRAHRRRDRGDRARTGDAARAATTLRSPPRSKARRPRSPKRKPPRSPPRPRTTMRAPNSKPRAPRWPSPKSACSGWKPRPRPSARCCRWRPAICGRR